MAMGGLQIQPLLHPPSYVRPLTLSHTIVTVKLFVAIED